VPGIWTGRSEPDTEPGSGYLEAVDRRRFDVVIVGSGYTGLSAARQLARAGASVAVLDRGQVGSGASSRNAGQVLTGLKLDVGTLVSTYGEARARELFEVSREAMAALEHVVADEPIACDLERTGHLQAAAKPSHLRAFRNEAVRNSLGVHYVQLGRNDDAREQFLEALELSPDHAVALTNRAPPSTRRNMHGLAGAATRAGAAILSTLRFPG
jgi:glycine/D-amino acid oxidase-like deaminating enzyme